MEIFGSLKGEIYSTYFRETADLDHAANGSNIYRCSNSISTTQTDSSVTFGLPGSNGHSPSSPTMTGSATPSQRAATIATSGCPATIDGEVTSVPRSAPLPFCTGSGSNPIQTSEARKHRLNINVAVGSSVGSAVGFLLLLIFGVRCIRNRRKLRGLVPPQNTSVSPTLSDNVERSPVLPFLGTGKHRQLANISFGFPHMLVFKVIIPIAAGKRALIQQNNAGYHSPSLLTSGYGRGSYAMSSDCPMPPNSPVRLGVPTEVSRNQNPADHTHHISIHEPN